jgi:hypothetical protein
MSSWTSVRDAGEALVKKFWTDLTPEGRGFVIGFLSSIVVVLLWHFF